MPSRRPGGAAALSSAECNPGAGVPTPYCCCPAEPTSLPLSPRKAHTGGRGPTPHCCFLAEPTSLPLSPRKAHTGGGGPTPYCCFPAESHHCPCPPGGPTLPTRTSPVEMCELISKTASLLFLLWRQDGRPLTRRSAPHLTREFSMSIGEKENQRLNQHKIIKALLLR